MKYDNPTLLLLQIEDVAGHDEVALTREFGNEKLAFSFLCIQTSQ